MFEYTTKRHAYNGEALPEDRFDEFAKRMGESRWELVCVTPVLGKNDLISFWKRNMNDQSPALVTAVMQAEDILDAALLKDGGRGELLDAATEALDVLCAALPAVPHRAPASASEFITSTPMQDPDVVYKNLVEKLGPIGMEDRSEPLPPPVPDEEDVPETSAEADLAESFEILCEMEETRLGRKLNEVERELIFKTARGG